MGEDSDGYQLLVVPLHGRGNKQGDGKGVRIYSYVVPENTNDEWHRILLDSSMHMTHNFDLMGNGDFEDVLVGGKEGSRVFRYEGGDWESVADAELEVGQELGFGEVRYADGMVAGIQPLHGNILRVFGSDGQKQILTEGLNQGHALAWADLLGNGASQLVVGWREADEEGQVGIKVFESNGDASKWTDHWIDMNGMACEDLKIFDLDGDGKLDIIASGRSTKNLKIYWNKN